MTDSIGSPRSDLWHETTAAGPNSEVDGAFVSTQFRSTLDLEAALELCKKVLRRNGYRVLQMGYRRLVGRLDRPDSPATFVDLTVARTPECRTQVTWNQYRACGSIPVAS